MRVFGRAGSLAVVAIVGLVLGTVWSAGVCWGQNVPDHLRPVLKPGQDPFEKVDVLIAFNNFPGPVEAAIVRAGGGDVKYVYWLVPAVAARMPIGGVSVLESLPQVARVELDLEVHAIDAELDNSWGVKRIGAGTVHDSGNKGIGVKVAIIDTGIDYTHPDLDANYAGGYDFVNNDSDPKDDNGHGTHVAGTVAAEDDDIGVVGVAPEAKLYALKVLNRRGSGSYSAVIAALEWAVDPNGDDDFSDHMDVTNNSYGSSGDPGSTVKAAFDNAYNLGILHVCAAGNSGNESGTGDNVLYPARYESCIAVAATDKNDSRASWSSTGPAVELAAPGVDVNSTLLRGGYGLKSGTSMACPHVAGTAALVIAAGINDVRTQLQNTADDLGATGLDTQYGYGLVDADEAAIPPGPQAPVANAGPDQTVSDGDGNGVETVTLDGSASYDPDGSISSYLWQEGGVTLGTTAKITAEFDVTGSPHTVTLTVTDNAGATGTDTVVITVNEPGATMHVGDLDGTKNIKGKSGKWEVLVTVTIHDQNGNIVSNATVTGDWSGATSGTVSGTTGSDGTVTFSTGNMNGGTSVTFTVTNVTHSSLTYDEVANHDPDGDSDGTSITVSK